MARNYRTRPFPTATRSAGEAYRVTVETTAMAIGGAAVARGADGRVVFVEGALPGETVTVAVDEERPRFVRGAVVEVLGASSARVVPPCPHVAEGCGGCGWQHVAPDEQVRLKVAMVGEALVRLGRQDAPVVRAGEGTGPFGYRTTVRVGVLPGPGGGRAGFRASRSHRLVDAGGCLTAHPRLARALGSSDLGRAERAVLRVGARTGEGVALLGPSARGALVTEGLVTVGEDELGKGPGPAYHEVVAGRRLRISARSFFQASPQGAEALVRAVGRALTGAGQGALVDAYAGVGLFASALGWEGEVVAVESSPSSAADARANLAGAEVVDCRVEHWAPRPAVAVVADPPRSGLGRAGVEVLAAAGAPCLVLVSCDAASLGRDAALAQAAGFRLEESVVMDMFPGTPHVEVVSRFTR